MNGIINSINRALSDAYNLLQTMRVSDIVDILLIAFVIFEVILFIRKTNLSKVVSSLAILVVFLWISDRFNLTVTNFLLRRAFELGLIALVIIFQPELRRVLEKVGSGTFASLFSRGVSASGMESVITQVVLACEDLSRTKTGALIIFERDNQLNDQINTGTIINADVTAELLKNVFYPKAPLHDGAAILRNGRLTAAGCMLPLSSNQNLSRDLGMRHRAGIGMSERSDAVVAIVSEETGAISVAVDGMLKRHLSSETFEQILLSELLRDETVQRRTFSFLNRKKKGDTK